MTRSIVKVKINLLVALLLSVGANARSAGLFFNVLDYGAHNDGSASSTEAMGR